MCIFTNISNNDFCFQGKDYFVLHISLCTKINAIENIYIYIIISATWLKK